MELSDSLNSCYPVDEEISCFYNTRIYRSENKNLLLYHTVPVQSSPHFDIFL